MNPHTCFELRHERQKNKGSAILAEKAGVKNHRLITINIGQWGGSSLTDKEMEIEDGDIHRTDIPVTYVPARNMVFLSIAASYAEAIGAQDIFIGISEVDYSGYVDCLGPFKKSYARRASIPGTVWALKKLAHYNSFRPFMNKTQLE